MSGKSVCLGSLVLVLLALGRAHGQGMPFTSGTSSGGISGGGSSAYRTTPGTPAGQDEPGGAPSGSLSPPAPVPPGPQDSLTSFGLSSWIKYPRSPGCCGPVGANGPIGSEIYFRSG